MKLEPIVNPHAKSGQGVQKKTKQEEKDDLIEKTKKTTIDKYGVGRNTYSINAFFRLIFCDILIITALFYFRKNQLARSICKILPI